ncbi:hypothetical protein D915_002894 [Fasciola hepatica]|uniref:Uncharacterized protein n=1 Tax=Fasciola hepatica TaxID=6192 RepID=A0A4E0RCF9_FASHE|nr:hypothetical protein D915_002894 [Fasciola hepatica]
MLSVSFQSEEIPSSRSSSHPILALEKCYTPYSTVYETYRIKREAHRKPHQRGGLHEIKQQYTLPRVVTFVPVTSIVKRVNPGNVSTMERAQAAVARKQEKETDGVHKVEFENGDTGKSPSLGGCSHLQEVNQQFISKTTGLQECISGTTATGERVIPVRFARAATPRLQEAYQQYTHRICRNTPLISRPGYSHNYTFEETNVTYRNSGVSPQPKRCSRQFFPDGVMLRERVR